MCYKNGKCMGVMFENINCGVYFPAVSLYNKAQATVNFGPAFKHPPAELSEPAAPKGTGTGTGAGAGVLRPFCESWFQRIASLVLADSIARVLNVTDVKEHKELVKQVAATQRGARSSTNTNTNTNTTSANAAIPASTTPAAAAGAGATRTAIAGDSNGANTEPAPPYHSRMRLPLRKKYRQYLMKQPVCVEDAYDHIVKTCKIQRAPDAHHL